MEACEVLYIPAYTAKTLMADNIILRKNIQEYISKRIKKTEERVFSLMMNGVKEFGQPYNAGYRVRNFLPHEDIANITTTSSQSISSTLMSFKKKGLIDYDSRNLSVFNL